MRDKNTITKYFQKGKWESILKSLIVVQSYDSLLLEIQAYMVEEYRDEKSVIDKICALMPGIEKFEVLRFCNHRKMAHGSSKDWKLLKVAG